MIKLSEHKVGLINLKITIDALETLDNLIAIYSDGKRDPAYLQNRHVMNEPTIQIDRAIMIEALQKQRLRLVEYLSTMGIDAN